MNMEIRRTGTFNPFQDRATYRFIWWNEEDGSSVVLFSNRVLHQCKNTDGPDVYPLDDEQTVVCPKGCKTPFLSTNAYEMVWKKLTGGPWPDQASGFLDGLWEFAE